MEFRKEYGLDTILNDYEMPEVIDKYLPGGFFGEDREGHPVWYEWSGNIDARGESVCECVCVCIHTTNNFPCGSELLHHSNYELAWAVIHY